MDNSDKIVDMNNYKPNEFAEMIGVSVKTLQRWDNEGKLKAFRNPSNRRFYTDEQYNLYMAIARGIDVKSIQDGNKSDRRTEDSDK